MTGSALQVLGLGAVTPLGLSVASTCAALRAQLSAYALSDLFHQSFDPGLGGALESIAMARLPDAFGADEFDEIARLVQAAACAVEEALIQSGLDPADCALIVGTREPSREHPDFDDFGAMWIRAIEEQLGVRFHPASCVVARGHVSALVGGRVAQQMLRERRVQACIVGGVDSLCNVYDLERYVLAYRVLGSTVSKGFVPGEGAAFFAVGAAGDTSAHLPVLIAGIGLASEDAGRCVLSDGHPTGRGLERALHDAIAVSGVSESRIRLRLSDVNGESYRVDETMLAAVRFYKTYRKHLALWHPAAGVGDLGAASGALLIVQGCHALLRGVAPGPVVMCESASDTPDRAACVLSSTRSAGATASAW